MITAIPPHALSLGCRVVYVPNMYMVIANVIINVGISIYLHINLFSHLSMFLNS